MDRQFTLVNAKASYPVLLEYSIQFTGEARPRTKRIVRAVPSKALVRLGIAPDRLDIAGAGVSNPVGSNNTLHCGALNRCVELQRTDR